MEKVTQRVSLGAQGNVIVVSHLQFDAEGFGTGQISAIVPIDPNMNAKEMLIKASKKKWQIGGVRNLGGFYEAIAVGQLTDEEYATRKGDLRTGRSLTVEYQTDEASILSEDIEHQPSNAPSLRPQPLGA